jgi:MFS family permease
VQQQFTVSGPLLAPIISGYTSPTIGWRWAFWIGLIYAGATLIPLVFLPETYGPVLLKRRAQAIRRRDPRVRAVAPHELDKKSLSELATVVLTRPLRMLACEPIVNTSCAYLALCYAIFYMSFEAFPVIFEGVYGFAPGPCGLTYLAVGVGCLLALPIFFAYDTILRDAQRRRAPWTRREESRRLPLACIGGPLFALSLFWLGWTARKDTHWAVPMLAGIPFGIGFMCIFQALLYVPYSPPLLLSHQPTSNHFYHQKLPNRRLLNLRRLSQRGRVLQPLAAGLSAALRGAAHV